MKTSIGGFERQLNKVLGGIFLGYQYFFELDMVGFAVTSRS